MATYATVDDYADFDPAFVVEDSAALEEALGVAERYIDMALGRYAKNITTGLKLVPADLLEYQTQQLAFATCAQAEFIMAKGPEFFINFQPDAKSSGRGVSVQGKETYLAPKARQHLSFGGLFRLVAGRGRRSLLQIPNQNIDQEPW